MPLLPPPPPICPWLLDFSVLSQQLQDEDGEATESDEEEEKTDKPKKYVPPKVAAMYYGRYKIP